LPIYRYVSAFPGGLALVVVMAFFSCFRLAFPWVDTDSPPGRWNRSRPEIGGRPLVLLKSWFLAMPGARAPPRPVE
ncbi:MAG: hypothetical protein ACYC23_19055, partial [Limisphaerales bacterium]